MSLRALTTALLVLAPLPGCVSSYVAAQGGYVAELAPEGPVHGGALTVGAGLGAREDRWAYGAGAGLRSRVTSAEWIVEPGLHWYALVPLRTARETDDVFALWGRAGTWLGGGPRAFRWAHSLELGGAVCPGARSPDRTFLRRRVPGAAEGVCVLLSGLAEYDLAFPGEASAPWFGAQVGLGLFTF